jgi:hypothetical protein
VRRHASAVRSGCSPGSKTVTPALSHTDDNCEWQRKRRAGQRVAAAEGTFGAYPSIPSLQRSEQSRDDEDQGGGEPESRVNAQPERLERNTTCEKGKAGPNPGQECALVGKAETGIRFAAVREHRGRKAARPSIVLAHALPGRATERTPVLPMDESSGFCDRAELRYGLQYEMWHR